MVKDTDFFKKRMKLAGIDVCSRENDLRLNVDPGRFGWPEWISNPDLAESNLDVFKEIAKHLADGEHAVIQEFVVSDDGVDGWTKVIDSSGVIQELRVVSADAAVKEAVWSMSWRSLPEPLKQSS